MAGVMLKFIVASMFMWIAPVGILYGFNNNIFPGSYEMDSYSLTLVSGFLAVISVNVVIAFYIFLAMKEPSNKHVPDTRFLAEAKASIDNLVQSDDGNSSQSRDKQE
uniref:Vacuolar ATPase assembly integral membrane protein VMA21 homolog n=1 Tax=Kalanchoe fedtschenkoi TaxID=63787 RepID=A0A7N0TV55_KALFE